MSKVIATADGAQELLPALERLDTWLRWLSSWMVGEAPLLIVV